MIVLAYKCKNIITSVTYNVIFPQSSYKGWEITLLVCEYQLTGHKIYIVACGWMLVAKRMLPYKNNGL